MLVNVQKFFSEVLVELRKVSWSTRREVIDSTWVVIISSAFLGVLIAIIDIVLSKLVGILIK